MNTQLAAMLLALCTLTSADVSADDLAKNFASPPASARPWVYWFWINGNISKEGITADLEAMRRVGIGGVLWMEVSGMVWAPDGPVTPASPQWHDCMQWAVRECERLGIEFDLSVDFGYGSGGPHITPELSMQKLYWSETEVEGGRQVNIVLPKPAVEKTLSAWLRPGAAISPKVVEQIEKTDSYREIAVVAIPAPVSPKGRAYRIPEIKVKDGTDWRLPRRDPAAPPPADAVTPRDRVVDLTALMTPDGRLTWDAPPGKWLVLRCGHASNFKMTRPCPQLAVGLECDRLGKAGIQAHYEGFLRKVFTDADTAAGKSLNYVHIDSWEAGGQNWTATFPDEFRARRGYDLRPWLPVLAGRVVGSAELSERFLWDMRTTVSEMIRDNYARQLRELAQPHRMKLSIEAYGHLCIDNLSYAGVSDMPISEFWARGDGRFPTPGGYEPSTKVMASAAHTYGRRIIAAESLTSDRGWRDHPFLLKAMGDQKFCEGLNRMIFHLSAHQPYDNMVPGLTHRRWGEHIQRHNTWFEYSRPWMDYLARCQHLLQQGQFVADVCYWFGEGAPLNVNDMTLEIPKGYEFDLCSSETVLQMSVKDDRVVLPSGTSYRYLRLPDTDRMTPLLARKVRELAEAGARIIGGQQLQGAPGLTDFPQCDAEVVKLNPLISGKTVAEAFAQDGLKPDFEGEGLRYIHRRVGEADVYFVSHSQEQPQDVRCTFRVAGAEPELWDPETGAIYASPEFSVNDGRTTLMLHFDPMQSWFVVFSCNRHASRDAAARNFPSRSERTTLSGPWQVTFDPKWGGPAKPVTFTALEDWRTHSDPAIHYYSGTAVYRTTFDRPSTVTRPPSLFLDLGSVEVMARVRVNGKDCGIAWKPPYLVDITDAVRDGSNELEIHVVNLWINRMIGDEQLPLDANWKDFETLLEWPEWFKTGKPRPSGRYTFSSCRHYQKDSPLVPSGLFGPVTISAPNEVR
jgi:hypothetical protein